MKNIYYFLAIVFFISCKNEVRKIDYFKRYNEDTEILEQQRHENPRMKFKLIQSNYLDLNREFRPFMKDLEGFSEEEYNILKPLILEKDIPSIQESVMKGKLTYEKLTLFYLYRILKFERDSTKYLNAVISLNPNVLNQAREKDQNKASGISKFSLNGMPIILKDNIDTKYMNTTAGAVAMKDHLPKKDAFIVERLKNSGALILGKANLSEWAYFFCEGCPLGYSALGGQTLNPYGRKEFETGGSSSGSGVSVAANYAVAAIGTETAGSITSPSSMNSVVGLKPTIGLLSRSGIIPISNTLDTPGPMTKSVIDNAILLEALIGLDTNDETQVLANFSNDQYIDFEKKYDFLKEKRVGVIADLLQDSIYNKSAQKIAKVGANIIKLAPEEMNYDGFLTLLAADMKRDFPNYFKRLDLNKNDIITLGNVVNFNNENILKRAPYGQQLFEKIVNDTTSDIQLVTVRENLIKRGRKYFKALEANEVDVILSINNTHSAVAAVAKFPTITVPMQYKEHGEPVSLTFIGRPNTEKEMLAFAFAFEQLTKVRKMPKNYQ
ncbi:amidase family protein [Tenacibaculum sp. C7A-26P2]|uniref:amidase family protein n=1 Tax=Tenacibaculum sp. C7A-26P2 TaxID=3447504 RepID=UPI003F880089